MYLKQGIASAGVLAGGALAFAHPDTVNQLPIDYIVRLSQSHLVDVCNMHMFMTLEARFCQEQSVEFGK